MHLHQYNAAVNQHMAVRISFEFLETGGVRPTADISPIRLFRYRGPQPYPGASVIALELLTFTMLLANLFSVRCRVWHSDPPCLRTPTCHRLDAYDAMNTGDASNATRGDCGRPGTIVS